MKIINLFTVVLIFIVLVAISENIFGAVEQGQIGWKAGVARVKITPKHSMWLAGYGSRSHPSTGTLVDLWAKALALEDANGEQAVLVTMDLLGIPKQLSDHIRNQLERKFGLSKAQIILNSSHTHTGPVLTGALVDIYPIKPHSHQQQLIDQYTQWLGKKIVVLVGEALHSMKPVQVYAGNGVARFQVNRRNNNESILSEQTDLNGPNDYAVPVLKVVDNEGEIMAITFGYACHNTVLSGYKWSGDYAGFAQIYLEKAYPGATTLFFQGAGGDQNPLPRRSVALAKQYGKTLAAAVETVIEGKNMEKLSPHLSTAYSEVELPLASSPTKEEFETFIKEASGYQKRWATRMLNKLEQEGPLRTFYPYPVEVWKLGDQTIIALGGEVTVGYAIRLKQIFGQDIFVLGYSNDVMAYIPTGKILREGGYEGRTGQMVYGLPATWAPGIEARILYQVIQTADKAGVKIPETKIVKN